MASAASIGPRISGQARRVPSWVVYAGGVLIIAWEIVRGVTSIDPVESLEHGLGMLSLQFLLASLLVTPLLRFGRINLVKFRKALGLLAFGALVLHLVVWIALDLQLRWGLIGAEIVKRPYLLVGFAAFLLLLPLAATSWQGAVRRMGAQAWGRLHRLVYPAILLGAVHFVMQEKVWSAEALLYLTAATILVSLRFVWIRAGDGGPRRSAGSEQHPDGEVPRRVTKLPEKQSPEGRRTATAPARRIGCILQAYVLTTFS